MDRLRYWLLLTISRRPKAFVRGAGVLVAVLLVAGALAAMVMVDHGRTAQRHAEALRIFEGITAESTALLDDLSRDDGLDCSYESLAYLNTRLLESRYLREIGLLDADRRLVCSTALGRLAVPVKGNYPVHVSRSGLELLDDIPLTMAGKKLKATIIQRPPVNVVVSPYATDDLNASADVLWLRTTEGLVALHAGVEPGLLPAMRARAGRLAASGASLRGLGYELVTMSEGQDLVLQTQRGLPAILMRGGALFPLLLAGSLLVAALAAGTIAPYVARLGHLRNRIGFLCDEAHLALVYQPVFELATGRPVGCEVLARLKEGDSQWLPSVMIPAILGAGLERRFDHAVARKAIAELSAHLPPIDERFGIALNCFPPSVDANTLAPVLQGALQASGRRDLDVCVEITEHSLASDLVKEVQGLQALGFLVAVDDFGTGYSNLKSVTRLSPDLLKIDGSFVYELEDATLRASLIPEIVRIAKAVGAETVAEGIQNARQMQLLLAEGVRYGQGFGLGMPMPVEEFVGFVAERLADGHRE